MLIYIIPILMASILASLYEFKIIKNSKLLYGLFILTIGLFGGLRFETGQDWQAYQIYFDQIDSRENLFISYFSNLLNLRFEFGYFFLNYSVKYLNGEIWVVYLIASIFCSYSVYRFTSRFTINRFYILMIYISYSFMLLHFAQVRQSLAVGCFLLGCDSYLKKQNKLLALAICAFGLIFQYSSLMYILILLLVFYWPNGKKYQIISVFCFLIVCLGSRYLDVYYLISLISPESASTKIEIYQEEKTAQGANQLIYGSYLLIFVVYLSYYSRSLASAEYKFISKFAIYSLLFTISLIFIFPGSYVMYSRGYVIASIFQGYAGALIFSTRKSLLHKSFFITTTLIAIIMYLRIISLYQDEYVPYHWIF